MTSASLSSREVTKLTVLEVKDAEHLRAKLFQSLPRLRFIEIGRCQSLSGWAILRCLTDLETLEISDCPELDWTEEPEDQFLICNSAVPLKFKRWSSRGSRSSRLSRGG